jgi:hypothetical protein
MARYYPNHVYDIINERHFNNTLPKVPVRWSDELPEHVMGRYVRPGTLKELRTNSGYIELSSQYRRSNVLWIQTLIHEMVHVEQRFLHIKNHGYIFTRRIKELVQRGAFNGLI